jgi:hypothetical protein
MTTMNINVLCKLTINCALFIIVLFSAYSEARSKNSTEKERVLVLTDIGNEPDDSMSLVRFLVYSNEFEVEGLVATTSKFLRNKVNLNMITERVRAYGQVRNNLLLHQSGYPTMEYLLSKVTAGSPKYGMSGVGSGNDSAGSELIISAVDKPDPRPLWITIWGGPNTLAQALWKVKNTRSASEVDKFISKVRVYSIEDQDDSGSYIRRTFPNLFYIYGWGWRGIGKGGDQSLVNNSWIDRNVRSHGPLGALYPHIKVLMEGDTPSFLYLIPTGLEHPNHPEYGSWGGRYAKKGGAYQDTSDSWNGEQGPETTVRRWRREFQNDFEARMDWNLQPYDKANHPPVAVFQGNLQQDVRPGERVTLSASGSSDPDGNSLTYKWFFYDEPSSYNGSLTINNANSQQASFTVPDDTGKTIHVILTVTDNGSPALSRYKRIIFTVNPKGAPVEEKVSISLAAGWNLISIPVQPTNTVVESVLSSIRGKYSAVYSYDGSNYQSYIPGSEANISKLESGRGYWIYADSAVTLEVKGHAASKSIQLNSGWNLVGYSALQPSAVGQALASINSKYLAVYGFDPTKNSYKSYIAEGAGDLTQLEVGKGYWLYLTQAATWTLS